MDKPRTPIEAVEAAISCFSSATQFAQVIDLSPQMVSFMRKGERQVPAEKCPLIERVTKYRVRCEELRPDVAWDVLRMQAGIVPDVVITDAYVGEERRAA
jgi:DNA-binding transcriptional regulator YdaS (Cro superfamily)